MSRASYASYIEFIPADGKTDDLLTALLQSAEAAQTDQTCIQYLVGLNEEAGTIGVWEVWIDQAAHDASLTDPETRAFIQQTMPLIAGINPPRILDLHGGKGLSS